MGLWSSRTSREWRPCTGRRAARPTAARRLGITGIHEYKGKFNPQVVRSFANLLGLEPGDWLLDPFCGSGTALVEGLSMGANVHGIDRSPLAVHLARTKVAAVRHRWPEKLAVTLESWMQSSFAQIERSQQQERVVESGLVHLDAGSRAYLERWFTSPALAAMSAALYARSRLDPLERALVDVAISSLCRSVSLQLPEDLRIRRRPDGYVAPPIAEALSEAVRNIAVGLRELAEAPFSNAGTGSVHLGSASSARAFRELRGRASRCAVITSPPYATALPYIDTDRLSITLLGLAPASRIGHLERRLFGSRDWSTAEAREWGERRATNQDALPQSIVALCAELHEAGQAAGFRRKAVPGLLYRYFVNMRDALSRIRSILRSGEERSSSWETTGPLALTATPA